MLEHLVELFWNVIIAGRLNLYRPIEMTTDEWEVKKHRTFSKNMLRDHLDEKAIYGLSGGHPTGSKGVIAKTIVIDIDTKKTSMSVEDRYSIVTKFFDSSGVVFRSSHSQGLHVYFRFDKTWRASELSDLQYYFNSMYGFNAIEVFPTMKGLRLPLGKGSYLLDPFDLGIMHANKEDAIKALPALFKKLDLTSKDRVLSTIRAHKRQVSREKKMQGNHDNYFSEIEALYNNGLMDYGTRNHSLLLVNQYLAKMGLKSDERETGLKQWIREKHNGNSHTVNAGNWRQIDREIESMCRSSFSGTNIILRLKAATLDQNTRDFLHERIPAVAASELSKFKITYDDYIDYLTMLHSLSRHHNTGDVPISVNLLRKLGAKAKRAHKLALKHHLLKMCMKGKPSSDSATIFRVSSKILPPLQITA
jgi:hypothetical protein